ncbi:leucine-rich repeat protein [Faecalibacterium prausnitzii]|uniref:leucine-rich repeat protein n=1 Tax=Faecalibacterium prausnitzii TaxID=853 RepID=UPI001CC03FBB|nr:leucine-rich repeat protein [Faecalibacterium prausnitzii]
MRPKRLISLLVAVCMMITMLPLSAVTAFAADTSSTTGTASYGDYEYDYTINTEDGTATITKFRALVDGSYDITIPTDFGRFPVTAIGDDAFRGCSALKKVTIPQSVTSIGDSAFAGCRNLDSLTINDAATSIGNRAFTECPLTTTLSLGKKITTIGDEAFYDCRGLTSVTIPPSVTSIGKKAFYQCIHLKTLSFGENIKTNIETIGDEAFYYCIELESVTIPQSVTSIGNDAFGQCHDLQSLTIKDAATSIGHRAFLGCTSLATISLGENIKTIGYSAFNSCTSINLTNVTIPENVTTIRPGTFDYCTHLEYIMLPAGLTSFQDSLKGCPAGNPNGAIYYKNYKAKADALLADNDNNSNIADNDKLKNRNFLYLCNVTFDANGGTLTDSAEVPVYKTEKITETKANDLTAIHDPTRAGYKFTGWYTEDGKDGKLFDVDETAITEDITLYARWELAPKAPVCHPLTLKDGVITSVTVPGKDGADPEDITEIVKKNANEDGSFNVPEGATVSVAFDKDAFADSGLKFGHWDITGLDDPNAYQNKESFDFAMPPKAVTLKAMTQDASIEDDEPNVLGTAAIIGTAAVGGAVLGYQAYSLGAEFAGKLMALPYFPSNRSALAMMLWEDAGKPMPESELLYPDVGQEEQDMDLQHAARWAMENELIPDLNDEGTAPEEMKFFPANPVSKLDVLNAWQKAQELKNN